MHSVDNVEEIWRDKLEINNQIYQDCLNSYLENSALVHHREFIKNNNLGYGEDPFHYLWWILLDKIQEKFGCIRFLEIGVFKGQVLSLVPYIAKTKGYGCEFKGVTPLSGAGDKYATYGAEDYLAIITEVFKHFQVPFDRSQNLIHGFSTNENTIEIIKKNKYNLLYIDGSHDYEDVVSDINLMHDILDVGGYLVMDDASSSLEMPLSRFGKKSFNGHPDVAKAIDDFLIKDSRYKHLFACGHNRVFRKEGL
jgi:hypothetical protein